MVGGVHNLVLKELADVFLEDLLVEIELLKISSAFGLAFLAMFAG